MDDEKQRMMDCEIGNLREELESALQHLVMALGDPNRHGGQMSRKGRRMLLTTSRLKQGWEARQGPPGKRAGTPPKNRTQPPQAFIDAKKERDDGWPDKSILAINDEWD